MEKYEYQHIINTQNQYINKLNTRHIADHYGQEAQTRQLIEEMAELAVAINKLWRIDQFGADTEKTVKAIDNFYEELADVSVVLEQVIYLFKCEDKVKEIMEQKINRTMEELK